MACVEHEWLLLVFICKMKGVKAVKKKLSLKSRVLTSVLLTIGLSLGTVGVANAATETIRGTLNRGGYLVQYNKVRMHSYTGPVYLRIFDLPSTYVRVGLTDLNHYQFTNSIQWNWPAKKKWTNVPKGKRFKIQARMGQDRFGGFNVFLGDLTH